VGFSAFCEPVTDDDIRRIKTDRRCLEHALEEAGRRLKRPVELSGDACRCPFHHDQKPSGSLHVDYYAHLRREWVYTCHGCPDQGVQWNNLNSTKPSNSGDAIAVLRVAWASAGKKLSFQQACEELLNVTNRQSSTYVHPGLIIPDIVPAHVSAGPPPIAIQGAEESALAAHQALIQSPDLIQRLWQQRAVDRTTVEQFAVGYEVDSHGREWWVFPIKHCDGSFMAGKLHAADGKSPKSNWRPAGAKSGDPLFPIDVQCDGTVWVCPGELIALAVSSLGLSAIGITSGEKTSHDMTQLVELLRGRRVGIVGDNDSAGHKWAYWMSSQLAGAGIEVRVVDLGLSRKGEDLGDWIVERRVNQQASVNDVTSVLNEAFNSASCISAPVDTAASSSARDELAEERESDALDAPASSDLCIRSLADIWGHTQTWKPVERIPSGLRILDDVLHGGFVTGAVHVIAGKPGNCKTQLGTQIAVNAARAGTAVGFISLEMTAADIGRLMLAQISGLPRRLIDRGVNALPDQDARMRMANAMKAHASLPLDLMDGASIAGGCSRKDLQRAVEREISTRGWKLIVVDHLGEIAPLDNDPSTQPLRVDRANMTALRLMAMQHDIAVVVVSPLRKAGNFKNATKRPIVLDDVLGSSAIGYALHTCTAVVSSYRKPPKASQVALAVLKNRTGPLPEKPLEMRWHPACGRIEDDFGAEATNAA
jgi:replicative DNA helicase